MKINSKGFTLIEVMIVAAILSIVSGVIFGTMNVSQIGLGSANNQINRQQEARRATNKIRDELFRHNIIDSVEKFYDIGMSIHLKTKPVSLDQNRR